MAVTLDHHGEGTTKAVVVRGVDHLSAVTHLCGALEHGGAPLDPLVIIDLSDAPVVAQAATEALEHAATALSRSHRWLGVVEPRHASASHSRDGWYRSTPDALRAGRDYASMAAGRRGVTDQVADITAGLIGIVTAAPEIGAAFGRACWRTARHAAQGWIGGGDHDE